MPGWKVQTQKPPAPQPWLLSPKRTVMAVAWLSLQEGFSAATQAVFTCPSAARLASHLFLGMWVWA